VLIKQNVCQAYKQIGIVEYDIVYSESYQVPVLYFRVFDSGGQVVTDLDVIHKQVLTPGSQEAIQSVGILGAISTAVGYSPH
jgi:ubiquitin-like-conjugating enzyme ATG10